MKQRFDASKISDQKRLVRGEQLLMARRILRARDNAHHKRWRVMIMPGDSPQGEISAIRELMPKAHITAVDKDPACLGAAIDAGVDEVIECGDLTAVCPAPNASHAKVPPGPLQGQEFDIIHLDFFCEATSLKGVFTAYTKILKTGGVGIVTFAYGRDVVEFSNAQLRDWAGYWDDHPKSRAAERMRAASIPDSIAGRLCSVFTPSQILSLGSVIVYRGNRMPMCSALYGSGGLSFFQVEPGDYELAVVYPDAASLYDCPKERIEGLRRRFSAIKASITRSLGTEAS